MSITDDMINRIVSYLLCCGEQDVTKYTGTVSEVADALGFVQRDLDDWLRSGHGAQHLRTVTVNGVACVRIKIHAYSVGSNSACFLYVEHGPCGGAGCHTCGGMGQTIHKLVTWRYHNHVVGTPAWIEVQRSWSTNGRLPTAQELTEKVADLSGPDAVETIVAYAQHHGLAGQEVTQALCETMETYAHHALKNARFGHRRPA